MSKSRRRLQSLIHRLRLLSGWPLLAVALLLAAMGGVGINVLHHKSEANLREQTTFVEIDGLVHRLHMLEGQALQPDPSALSPGERQWANDRAAELADARVDLETALANLRQEDEDDVAAVATLADRYFAANDELARLAVSETFEQVQQWKAQQVDPAFAAWDAYIEQQIQLHVDAANSTRRLADLGTAIALFLAGCLVFLLLRRIEKVRRRAVILSTVRKADAKFRTLVEQLPAVVYIEDLIEVEATGHPVHAYNSRAIESLYGYSLEEWDADFELWNRCLHPDDRERVLAEDARTDVTGDPFQEEYRIITRDGRTVWIKDQAVLIHDEKGDPVYWQGIQFDVTALKDVEQKLAASEEQFRLLFAANPHPMWVYDRETLRLLEVNDAAIAHYGYERSEFLAMSVADLRPAEDVQTTLHSVDGDRHALQADRGRRHLTKDGRVIDVDLTSHVLTLQNRDAVLVVAQDVTARLALERQLKFQAFHDPLTLLPNRALFCDRLGHALDRAHGQAGGATVFFLDLDDFKVINDTLGHDAGDRLLVLVADRLRVALRPEDTLARLGGDEFTILLEDLPDLFEAHRVAERLAAALRPEFHLDGRDVLVSASLGIAVPSTGKESPDDLLRLADVAMYEAKRRGKNRFAVFDAGMDARAWKRLELEAELRLGIEENQLQVHYQPLVELATGRIVEAEALVRWLHPKHGLLSPSDFIPLAEESGLIVPLGRWVLDQACRHAVAWGRSSMSAPSVGVAVNLSARQFRHPGLADDIVAAIANSGLEARLLKLEITETAALEDAVTTAATMRSLADLGVGLAIDDFGAGYSGLSYLRRCPVDALKIDRAYVAGLGRDLAEASMVRAIVAFARELGLSVTAEGVETESQLAALRALGCERGQGFLFARPMTFEEMSERLRDSPPPVQFADPLANAAD